MANENNPQQQKQNPTGSSNPADKSRNNPSHGNQDPQDNRKQDVYKKNPSQDTDTGQNEEEQEPGQEKRRAS
jgi:hypothetical protein